MQPGAWNSVWVPQWVAAAQEPGPFSTASPGALARSWIKSGAANISTNVHTECQSHRQQLNPVYHNAGSSSIISMIDTELL